MINFKIGTQITDTDATPICDTVNAETIFNLWISGASYFYVFAILYWDSEVMICVNCYFALEISHNNWKFGVTAKISDNN